MSEKVEKLIDSIERCFAVLDTLDDYFREYREQLPTSGIPGRNHCLVIAQLLENTYTALETAFMRISQYFENSLSTTRWHGDLLEKMTYEIEGMRPRVISDQSRRLLLELLRFRHFKRYYFELDYDWEKLKFLMSVYDRVLPKVREELADFRKLIDDSISAEGVK
jgi:hypothetical protein